MDGKHFELPPEYIRDIVIFIVLFVILIVASKLYYDFKERIKEKKLYKLYHQHVVEADEEEQKSKR